MSQSNANTGSTSGRYAAVPTSEAIIHEIEQNTIHDPIDETLPMYFATCATSTAAPDIYSTNVVWTAISMDVPPAPPLAQNGDIMQEVGRNLSCPLTRTWVVDARDNRTYWIRLIPNSGGSGIDLCWMETNLAYGGGGTNTYSDVLPVTTNAGVDGGLVQTSSGSVAWDNTNARVHTAPGGSTPTVVPNAPSLISGAGGQYGFLYNWCATMGGRNANPNACDTTSTTGFTAASICPFGWRLPNAQPTTGGFSALNNAENGGQTTTISTGLRTNWLGVYGGYYLNGLVRIGNEGNYWSSTANAPNAAHFLSFNPTSVTPAPATTKSNGISIHCVQ